jgi:hypothetical protein
VPETGAAADNGRPVDFAGSIADFWASEDQQVAGADAGPIERAFFANDGPIVHKWHHYLPVYDRYFAPFRDRRSGRPLRFLEIGVSGGGSLALWRKYFGEDAIIFGVDIDEKCRALDSVCGASVRIGSQDDEAFMRSVVSEMGGEVDIVLDDGSHITNHVNRSFDILFPLVADGGVYMVEDLHTSYWPNYGGGYRKPGTFIERTKQLIDEMHHWWHGNGQQIAATKGCAAALHVYDSMVIIEKDNCLRRPVHSVQGQSQR